MILKKVLTALAILGGTSLGLTFDEVTDAEPLALNKPVGKYIVELDLGFNSEDPLDSLRQGGLEVSINNQFDSPIFNGVSLDIRNSTARTLEEIKALPGIKDAWEASYVTLDFKVEDTTEAKWNPHGLTGVDKVHLYDLWGEGVRIAVIDSGVDSKHPAFADNLVPGYDFTDNPRNPKNDSTDCIGHGTFVSSVIVGNSDVLIGVAPQATIKMYKVFGCSPTTTDDIILAAMIKAYSENPDVMSLSLGSDRGYPSIPVSLVAAKIAETIPIVFAAGNSGSDGLYRASSGASGKGVIAVASVEADQLLSWSGMLYSSSGDQMPFQYVSSDGSNFGLSGSYGVDYLGDLCTAGSYGGSIDGTNRFMAGYKGQCDGNDILQTANLYGYMGVIVFASQAALKYSHMRFSSSGAQLWGMSTYDALYWMYNEATYGSNFWASFSTEDSSVSALPKSDAYSGVINSFTSWGPTFSQGFYPHIAAPGGDVLGAKIGGGYSISSGTSFACPYISGVIALFLGANGRTDPLEIRNRLIGAGRLMALTLTVKGNTATDKQNYAPVIQQGNGLVDAVSFFETNTRILSSPYLELNDTIHRVSTHTITVMNDGNYDIHYTVSTRELPSVFAMDAWLGNVASYFPQLSNSPALVELSETTFTIPVGQQVSFDVTINPPSDLDQSKAPIFQGAIDISGNNGELVTVPYMGIQVDTHLWSPWAGPPLIVGKDLLGKLKNLTSWNHNFAPNQDDSPVVYHNIRFGTQFYSYDLVEQNFNLSTYLYPMTSESNGFIGPLVTNTKMGGPVAFPIQFAAISSQVSFFGFLGLSSGSRIPNGKFRILCRALKPFGDYSNFNDWQLYLSDPFTVQQG